MDLSMALPANSLKVIKAQSDVWIVDVVRCEFNFVVNNLGWFKYSIAQAPLTQMMNVLHVG